MTKQTKTPEDWKKITKKELYDLTFKQIMPDSVIAKMYGVSKNAVTYKRRVKFGMKVSVDSDAFRQSCRERSLEELGKIKGISKKNKELVRSVILKQYEDVVDVV